MAILDEFLRQLVQLGVLDVAQIRAPRSCGDMQQLLFNVPLVEMSDLSHFVRTLSSPVCYQLREFFDNGVIT